MAGAEGGGHFVQVGVPYISHRKFYLQKDYLSKLILLHS